MDPLTAGLFIAASFASNLYTSKSQAKIEQASLSAQVAQSRLQTAESAYERTRQFRQNLSANLALSGMGVGGVSGFRGVSSREISDYFADISALGSQDMFSTLSATAGTASSKARRFARDVSSATDAATLASQLGLFSTKKAPSTTKKALK